VSTFLRENEVAPVDSAWPSLAAVEAASATPDLALTTC
jgi:hypothetical protein